MKLPASIQALIDRGLGWAPVTMARRVFERFDQAGGGLLAGGLTYSALFALLPTLLLLTGVLGFVVEDAERRAAVVEGIGQSLPPLQGFLAASLESIKEGAAGAGMIGLIGLAWGASRFYGSLDDAFARIFTQSAPRGLLERTVRGIVSVLLLVGVFLVALVLTGLASFLAEQTTGRLFGSTRMFWALVTPLLTLLVFIGGMALIYRVVPPRPIPWRAVLLPAVVIGVGLTLLTQLFSYIAPRIIGAAAVYGTFVAIFAAMIWLAFGFQLLLLGAAWIRERIGPPAPHFLEH